MTVVLKLFTIFMVIIFILPGFIIPVFFISLGSTH